MWQARVAAVNAPHGTILETRHGMSTGRVDRRALRDWALSLTSVLLLVLAIRGIDGRLGGVVSSGLGDRSDAAVRHAGKQVGSLVGSAANAARDSTMGRAPLVGFAIAGIVLVIVMVRIHN